MAKTARNSPLETRTARAKLAVRNEPYYVQVLKGVSLGYRKTKDGYGNWQVRILGKDGKYTFQAFGTADDYQDANGVDVLNYFQAFDKARELHNIAVLGKPSAIEKPLTVGNAVDDYLAWFKENRKSYDETKATIEAHILPTFGKVELKEIRAMEIKKWLNQLATQPPRRRTGIGGKQAYGEKPATSEEKRARRSTANRILTVFKAILNKAFQDELVSDDTPWRQVSPFENTDQPITRFLTEAESIRLVNACREDFRDLVKAALFTGARYGELTRLMVTDINPDTRAIYLREPKNGKGRHVPLSDEGLDFFKSRIASKTGAMPVFIRKDGEPWGKSHQARLLADACKIAKIEPALSFHELRHTYASLLAQAGADLLTISKLLGHADTRITSRHYAHLCDKTLANTVNKLLPSFGHTPESKVIAIK